MKKVEARVTKIFDLVKTTNKNQIECARKLENLTNAVNFIRKKFEVYEAEKREKDEVTKSLRGEVLALHNNLGNLKVKLDKQEQYSLRNCLLIHDISENKDKDTDYLVIKALKTHMNIDRKVEQIDWINRIGNFKKGGGNK